MGYKIVLTADRTLMSEYNSSIFLGFAACGPSFLPNWLYKLIFCPSVEHRNGVALKAPLGLRKIEASLLSNGISEDDIVVAHPDYIDEFIDKDTKVLGITTNDPLGLGPASSTFGGLMGREPYTAIFFRELVTNPMIRKYGIKVIVGGQGAWQLNDEKIMAKYNIDTICMGEGEEIVNEIFSKALNGGDLPRVVETGPVPIEKVPIVKKSVINGFVEIARGCGRGCDFCNPTMLKFRCFPLDRIVEEVKANVLMSKNVTLHAEDVLRYKAKGMVPNEEEVVRLFESVSKITKKIGMSHIALASVVAKPSLIERISEILEIGKGNRYWVSAQTGIETGSPELASEHLKGKAKPHNVKDWPNIVKESFKILNEAHWVPCATLIIGLPGEKNEDIMKTIKLVEELGEYKSFIVPLFFVPIGTLNGERFFGLKDMRPEHWKLIATCIKHDMKWIYPLIDELFSMNNISSVKKIIMKNIVNYAYIKLAPYLESMEKGKNPFT
ncbi:MAG: radical SAM protein [Candidatus Thermoplasmatota archaeon]